MTPPIHSAGCPRCGLRDVGGFKYCPNCAFRLVPEIAGAPAEAKERLPLGERLVALGGYLAVTSLLLLVVLAGIRLFMEEELASAISAPVVRIPRDGTVAIGRAHLVEIPPGTVLVGPLGTALWDEDAEAEREAAERRALDALEAGLVLHRRTGDSGEEAERRALDAAVAERLGDAQKAIEKAVSLGPSSRGFDTPRPWGTLDDPFRIGAHEVTNDQYYEFLVARAARGGPRSAAVYPADWTRKTGDDRVERIYDGGRGDHPVAGIPFAAALEFCAWVWEEKLGKDRDLVVDLPTDVEFVHAGRRNRAAHNFPWGAQAFDYPRARYVLRGEPRAVNDEAVGEYDELFGLVGNVAEWVWGIRGADRDPMAAGWSFKDSAILESFYTRGVWRTPFGEDGFEYARKPREDLGFRIVVRREPALPEFEPVRKGACRHRDDYANPVAGPASSEDAEQDDKPRIVLRGPRTVAEDFEIARTETTNRQYLEFLVDVSHARDVLEMAELQPLKWDRLHPYADVAPLLAKFRTSLARIPLDAFAEVGLVSESFESPWGDPRKIPYVYDSGQGNRPVQGISLEQAQAYAEWLGGRLGAPCRVPTVAEYLRAGRGDALTPYPWGDSGASRELACGRRTDSEGRSFSLLGRLSPTAPRIVGLAGNLPEYVVDERDGKAYLAGGCFLFPAEACTLDSFLDAEWDYVEWPSEDGVTPEGIPARLSYYTGFRVVRASAP